MTNRELKEAVELLREQAKEQQNISSSLEGYLAGLKRLKGLQQTIATNKAIEGKLEEERQKAIAAGDIVALRQASKKLRILKDQTAELEKQGQVLADNLEKVNKGNLLMTKIGAGAVKALSSLPDLMKNSYGKLKSYGLFEMSKATKTAALQMGLMGKQSDALGENIRQAALDTNEIGIGMESLSKMQSSYSEGLGRAVQLSKEGLKSMAAMAAASGLGEEGTSKLIQDMDAQGLAAKTTKDYMEQTMNDSHKMGLNASKVIKNIAGNMKMLNKYNFKGGVKGLQKMAQTTSKLGVEMTFVGTMAEKLWDIEGAVDMSAQLQVLGGAWAQLADPFKLMYLATNDVAGLTEEVGKAAEASVTFNKATGEMSISSAKMRELREVAKITGLSLEEVAEAGKKARKFTEMKKQMNFTIPDDLKEFMANTGEMNDKGEATISIAGDAKLLKTLSKADIELLRKEMAQKATFEQQAKTAQTFDDALTNAMNTFKTAALPLINSINNELGPKLKAFMDRMKSEGWLEKIGEVASKIGSAVSYFGGLILEYPKTFAALIGGAKVLGFLFSKLEWIMNGRMLAKGFLSGTGGAGGGGGPMGQMGGKAMGITPGAGLKANFKGGLGSTVNKLGGVVAGLTSAYSEFSENSENGMGTGENIGRTVAKGAGAGLGAWGGAAAGAAIGSVVPVVGTLIGGIIGGALGAWGGGELGEGLGDLTYGDEVNDAIVSGGKISPIDKKDDLIAMKPDGGIMAALGGMVGGPLGMLAGGALGGLFGGSGGSGGGSENVNHTFSPLTIKGEIMLNFPGNPGDGVNLLKNEAFVRSMSGLIMTSIDTNKNGGTYRA
jgi:hypothetical protein